MIGGLIGSIFGMPIQTSPYAVKRVENWPVKQRSKRLHKKLLKKRGPQFSERPAAFILSGSFVVHPDVYSRIEKETINNAIGMGAKECKE